MPNNKDLLSELESIAAGVAPTDAPLPHQLRDTAPPPAGDEHSPERAQFDRWLAAQELVMGGGTVTTIKFGKAVMVNRKFTYFVSVVRGGRLDGRLVPSSTREEAISEHARLVRRLEHPRDQESQR